MKRLVQALVMTAALAAVVAPAATAQAISPVVALRGEAALTQLAPQDGGVAEAARFHVGVAFSTDPPEAQPLTIQRATVFFPDRAGTNGRLFPSCGAAQIERFNGNVRRCPTGSQIGSGTVRAKAMPLGVTATGRVAIFNSGRGRSVTFNIQTYLPAYINESIDAPLTQLRGGRYGEKLTLTVPHELQEIIPEVYVGVQEFDVTLSGAVRVRGETYSYLRARRCPRTAMHGVFDFKDWPTGETASTTADARVRCSAR